MNDNDAEGKLIKRLREITEAATPGSRGFYYPKKGQRGLSIWLPDAEKPHDGESYTLCMRYFKGDYDSDQGNKDMLMIAAWNRETALHILDRLEEAERGREKAEQELKVVNDLVDKLIDKLSARRTTTDEQT